MDPHLPESSGFFRPEVRRRRDDPEDAALLGRGSALLPTGEVGRFPFQVPRVIDPTPTMQARAHLKLIVSEAPRQAREEPTPERVSLVQPVSRARLRLLWLRSQLGVIALCSAWFVLLSVAVLIALGER